MEKGFTIIELATATAMLIFMGGFCWVALHFIIKFW